MSSSENNKPHVSIKTYECTNCGHETEELTNHFGEIYTLCKVCGNNRHKYTGEIPEGGWVPPPWTNSNDIKED